MEFTVEHEVGTAFLGDAGGLDDLVDHLMLGTALGGEAQDGGNGIDLGDGLGGVGGADGDLSQLDRKSVV